MICNCLFQYTFLQYCNTIRPVVAFFTTVYDLRPSRWKQYGFNNHTYCHKIRRVEPYNIDYYYHDLFDFAVLDSMMYHYDSKHYALNDKNSPSHGMTVKLDNGRA